MITARLEVDTKPLKISVDFGLASTMNPKPGIFKTLAKSHQNYFSKWIESAKTEGTKQNGLPCGKRFVETVGLRHNDTGRQKEP